MAFHRTGAIILRQIYLMRGSVTRILPLFVWVAIDVVLWGFITRYLSSVATPGFNMVTTLLGAVLLWDFLTRVMQGVSMAFLEDVWTRNFLNIFATPLTVGEYVSGLVLCSITTSMVGLVVMLVLAGGLFGLSVFAYGIYLFPFLFILFLFGIALGIFGSAVVLRLGPAAEWFIWPIPAILSPFAAVFYPLSVLPHWMQAVAHAMPPAYVFENMRSVVAGGPASREALLAGGGLAAGYIALACVYFLSVYRYAIRTGLIARYSAESLS